MQENSATARQDGVKMRSSWNSTIKATLPTRQGIEMNVQDQELW
jgi:hypothetical protein